VLTVHSVNASLYDNSRNCFQWFVTHVVSGAIAKLRKATVSFVMSVHPSVCLSVYPHGTTQLSLNVFSWNLIFDTISKICRENWNYVKIWYFTWRQYVFFIITRSVVLRRRHVSDTSSGRKTHISCSKPFFENHAFRVIMWKKTW
jgi:hypothetical protein